MSKPKTSFEILALAKLLREKDQRLFLELDQELFSNHYQSLFKLVLKHFSDSHEIPNLQVLESVVNSKAPPSLRPMLNSILMAMQEVDLLGVSTEAITSGLKDKHLLTVVDTNIQELNNAAMQKDTTTVRKLLNQITEDINLDSVRPMDMKTAMEMPDQSKIITTGIEGFDEFVIGYSGLSIVSGGSGTGKSIWLLQSAIGQYLTGHNIMFISLELSPQVLGNRMKSFLTGIPFGKINTNNLSTEEREQIKDTMAKFWDRENVFRIISDGLDSEELLNLIRVEKTLYNIDICYLDYINLVSSPQGSQGGWVALQDLARSLHRLSMRLGVVTVSAAQVSIEKLPKNGGYPTLVTRGSAELVLSASLWVFLYAPDADADDGTNDGIIAYVMKNRQAPMTKVLFSKRFETMHYELVMEL